MCARRVRRPDFFTIENSFSPNHPRPSSLPGVSSAPWKGAGQQRVKVPPGNWFVPPGNEAEAAVEVTKPLKPVGRKVAMATR